MNPRRSTVLLVDDDAALRQSLASIFDVGEYEVAHAADGNEALTYCLEHPAPSMIILDIDMPKMNGWQFLSVLRCYRRLVEIPVLILSGGEMSHAMAAVYPHLTKPADPAMLLSLVKELTDTTRIANG